MDDQPLTNGGNGNSGGGGVPYSLLQHPTVTTALSLPRRSIFLGDCADLQSVGVDDSNNHTTTAASATATGGRSYCCARPIMVLDLIWNLAFVLVSVFVLLSAIKERPSTPLRLWVSGYAFQCFLHVGFVFLEYRKRRIAGGLYDHDRGAEDVDDEEDRILGGVDGWSPSSSRFQGGSCMKRLESINTMISSIWWVIGFYWIVVGGQALLQDSPRLYWLTVVFLAFDVFFIIFCIGMAFIVFLAVFCCIPILAIACAVAARKGASEDDIRSLPKYRYRQDNPSPKFDNDKEQDVFEARVGSSTTKSADELLLLPEDSECCICLSRYVDGVELYTLPCNHHFHCGCISKWLRINATCPLCKFDIRRADTLV